MTNQILAQKARILTQRRQGAGALSLRPGVLALFFWFRLVRVRIPYERIYTRGAIDRAPARA
jgi:hypothetical protein